MNSFLTTHTAPLGNFAHAQLLVNLGYLIGGSDVPDKSFVRKLLVQFNVPHPTIDPKATRDFLALPPSVHADVKGTMRHCPHAPCVAPTCSDFLTRYCSEEPMDDRILDLDGIL